MLNSVKTTMDEQPDCENPFTNERPEKYWLKVVTEDLGILAKGTDGSNGKYWLKVLTEDPGSIG